MKDWAGVSGFPATPFRADPAVDSEALGELVDWMAGAPEAGLFDYYSAIGAAPMCRRFAADSRQADA